MPDGPSTRDRSRAVSDEFTPTTEQVRRDYAYVLFEFGPTPRKMAEFDRWHERVKAEAQVEALRHQADAFDQAAQMNIEPLCNREAARVLRGYAAQIAREAGIEAGADQ